MKVPCGEYLTHACKTLKTEDVADMKWKVEKSGRHQTAEKIAEEDRG